MFNRLSIRYKLVVLLGLSAALGLFASSLIVLASSFAAEKESALRSLQQIASITSENMRAALAFHDAGSAQKTLAHLSASPHILYAFVTGETGNTLGQYQADGVSSEDVQAYMRAFQEDEAENVAHWQSTGRVQNIVRIHHRVLQRIELDGTPVGVLGIVSDNEAMYAKMRGFVYVQIITSLLILSALLLISMRLQHLFTRPIYELIRFMRKVAQTKNYSEAFQCSREDEFSKLCAGFNAMLSEIRIRDEQLRRLATTDPLTGLANRRQAVETLENFAQRAERTGEPIGVIMLDIDHFKQINDNYGHPAGDEVLRQLAGILSSCARTYDLAARLGGEEFVVLCEATDQASTLAIAERIRLQVLGHAFKIKDGRTIPLTISLGVHATLPEAHAATQLLDHADQALYAAKQRGRNRSVAWQAP